MYEVSIKYSWGIVGWLDFKIFGFNRSKITINPPEIPTKIELLILNDLTIDCIGGNANANKAGHAF
jgi:hypothetical protein